MELDWDQQELARARTFWAEEDVLQAFSTVSACLDHLQRVLLSGAASDKDYVQAFRLLQALDCSTPDQNQELDHEQDQDQVLERDLGLDQVQDQNPSQNQGADSNQSPEPDGFVVQVVVGELPATGSVTTSAQSQGKRLLPPVSEQKSPQQEEKHPQHGPHHCSQTCVPLLPRSPSGAETAFYGADPLQTPLICGFRRMMSNPGAQLEEGEFERAEELQLQETKAEEAGLSQIRENGVGLMNLEQKREGPVRYGAPCGRVLHSMEEVLRYLVCVGGATLLPPRCFSFDSAVSPAPPSLSPSPQLNSDLSRGLEPAPVELLRGPGGEFPPPFRYRRERWPHGAFLSRGPALFMVCCDCTGDCTRGCACAAFNPQDTGYRHQRLNQPVEGGLFECGPWCGCDRGRCQNRVVQGGVTVRLQVFPTPGRGWGVRCRDDLDRGTFICTYAGVLLQRLLSPDELPPPKLSRSDLPSDDEVEVVTEWLAPPVLEHPPPGGPLAVEAPAPPGPPATRADEATAVDTPLHVPVIQRPPEAPPPKSCAADTPPPCTQVNTMVMGAPPPQVPAAAEVSFPHRRVAAPLPHTHHIMGCPAPVNGARRALKRAAILEDVCFLDASREGNVGRFLNHSCEPNLFLQNVFTDSHDPNFPTIAFFTNRCVPAGTELTWDYSAQNPAPLVQQQQQLCLCGSSSCRGHLHLGTRWHV